MHPWAYSNALTSLSPSSPSTPSGPEPFGRSLRRVPARVPLSDSGRGVDLTSVPGPWYEPLVSPRFDEPPLPLLLLPVLRPESVRGVSEPSARSGVTRSHSSSPAAPEADIGVMVPPSVVIGCMVVGGWWLVGG